MIFCDIELNECGVEEGLEKIYELKPDFKKILIWLERTKIDNVKDFEFGKIIEKVKIAKKHLLPEKKKIY